MFNCQKVIQILLAFLCLFSLIACTRVYQNDGVAALFTSDALANAVVGRVSSVQDLPSVDLNNTELNIEGEAAPEELDSELSSQAVLAGARGYLVYYRKNTSGTYEIWRANQATDEKVKIWSGSFAVQSVAVSGDGNWVAASMINPSHGEYDVYLFNVTDLSMVNLTNSNGKDELDVSMTADGSKVVFSKPTNAGLSKINICSFNSSNNSCALSVLGASDNQRQASITGNGHYIALVRDVGSTQVPRWRVLLYDVSANTYTIVTTRFEELSDPSATADGKNIMYLRDRTSSLGKYLVRIKNLDTNVIDNELSKANLGHPHITPDGEFFTYSDNSSNGTRAFTRNIQTNERASSQAGNWDYYQPYWQANSWPTFEKGLSWWWQINNTENLSEDINVDVYNIDLFDVETSAVTSLKQKGKKVICYLSAGSYENWRDDAAEFQSSDIGNALPWEGEYWLDIRSSNVRRIMQDRLDLAQVKGCDAVEPDNVDAYECDKYAEACESGTGFSLTESDQLSYNRFLANEAHARGLAIGLKNDMEQLADLVDYFDFAVNERCYSDIYVDCNDYVDTFLAQNKAVFNQEYGDDISQTDYLTNACPYFQNRMIASLWKQSTDLNGRDVTMCQ